MGCKLPATGAVRADQSSVTGRDGSVEAGGSSGPTPSPPRPAARRPRRPSRRAARPRRTSPAPWISGAGRRGRRAATASSPRRRRARHEDARAPRVDVAAAPRGPADLRRGDVARVHKPCVRRASPSSDTRPPAPAAVPELDPALAPLSHPRTRRRRSCPRRRGSPIAIRRSSTTSRPLQKRPRAGPRTRRGSPPILA